MDTLTSMPARQKIPSEVTPEIAIQAALAQNWKEAIRTNTELVRMEKSDVDSLNRLGYALLKTGQITAAKRTLEKVLKLDPYNQIALKNSKKLTTLKRKDLTSTTTQHISPLLFLEDPGKTKIVNVVNPPPTHILSALSSGQEVSLIPKNHTVEIRTDKNAYLGVLPDDLSFKLLKLLEAGNQYQVHVKSIGKNSLSVMVREISRGKKFAQQPTFFAARTFVPSSRTVKEGDAPDVTPTGEDDGEAEEETPPPTT